MACNNNLNFGRTKLDPAMAFGGSFNRISARNCDNGFLRNVSKVSKARKLRSGFRAFQAKNPETYGNGNSSSDNFLYFVINSSLISSLNLNQILFHCHYRKLVTHDNKVTRFFNYLLYFTKINIFCRGMQLVLYRCWT